MKNAILIILVALPISTLLISAGLRYLEHQKRRKEKKHHNHLKLKHRKIGSNFSFNSNDIDTAIIQMIEMLKRHGGKLTHQIKHVAIIYLGESSTFKFNGLINTPMTELPMRIIITTNAHDDTIVVRIEEDYGFQLFAGPVRTLFKKRYHDAFTYYKELLSGCLV